MLNIFSNSSDDNHIKRRSRLGVGIAGHFRRDYIRAVCADAMRDRIRVRPAWPVVLGELTWFLTL
jgi:hypothetical protein